ncbi:(2Fe-2S)-binding protein [Fulvivirgaceae bacterium PWU4]|uniref:(2Fe-2S)-binding protein n=1 Tax=Chryseosolibacter histidini TaxID=2782349 RepID=A0AAP2DIM4_9BACT|nr:(2Fe-2S)-binding protein [Chryseosolibacter histidini]MBT1697010.1 (2Fe-2S)-binding protein [Chryseosolibacter histidini]
MAKYTVNVNRRRYEVEAEPDVPLLWILRDYLGLKGTKFGCGIAACGACTIHLNGNPVRSCQLRISAIPKNSEITTIEGVGATVLHPVQQAWIELQVPQCGYCQSGQIMSAVALLEKTPDPTDKDIDSALAGNLCRCGTYDRIRKAIHLAAGELKN